MGLIPINGYIVPLIYLVILSLLSERWFFLISLVLQHSSLISRPFMTPHTHLLHRSSGFYYFYCMTIGPSTLSLLTSLHV